MFGCRDAVTPVMVLRFSLDRFCGAHGMFAWRWLRVVVVFFRHGCGLWLLLGVLCVLLLFIFLMESLILAQDERWRRA